MDDLEPFRFLENEALGVYEVFLGVSSVNCTLESEAFRRFRDGVKKIDPSRPDSETLRLAVVLANSALKSRR